jgi:beta-D-xylosidase 4
MHMMLSIICGALAVLMAPSAVLSQSGPLTGYPDCVAGPLSKFPICDPSLLAVDRARDIVSRLNVSEKVIRIGQSYGANAIPRVGLPPYHWRQNAVHGLGPGVIWTDAGQTWSNCTVFPHVINIGATFDKTTFRLMGEIVSTEARAFANVGRAGLDWFTPNINIYRDPRWGRGQETPGEDPTLTSIFGVQFVTGLQRGEDPRYIKVIADCKHYAG